LFTVEEPDNAKSGRDFKEFINPKSLEVITNAKLEPSLSSAKPELRYQFERVGYFCLDSEDFKTGAPVFNRTISLKDAWVKEAAKA
jgi:glutaminyl-tRNA synthetase